MDREKRKDYMKNYNYKKQWNYLINHIEELKNACIISM